MNDGEVVDDVVVVVVVGGGGGGCSGADDFHDGDEDAPPLRVVRWRAATPEHLRSETKREEEERGDFPRASECDFKVAAAAYRPPCDPQLRRRIGIGACCQAALCPPSVRPSVRPSSGLTSFPVCKKPTDLAS